MMPPPTSLRSFLTIWGGQTASVLGSRITNFALTLWVWEATGQATPLSLLVFFTATPPIVASLFSGIIIDRFPRKRLMLLGDTVAGFSTIALLLLFLTDTLAIWHLYLAAAVSSLFSYLQWMSLSASMSMIIPQQHYTRASALESARIRLEYFSPSTGSNFILRDRADGNFNPRLHYLFPCH